MSVLYRPPDWATREDALERLREFRLHRVLRSVRRTVDQLRPNYRELCVHAAALLLVVESYATSRRSLAQWSDRALFLALRWGCGRLMVNVFLLCHFCIRGLAPLVLLVPKCSEATGTLAPSLAIAFTAVVDYALFSATASYLFAWSGALALLAFVKVDKAILRRSLQVVGGGWLTTIDARVRATATRLRLRYAGPALAFLQLFWLVLFVVWPRSAGALEAAREDARAAVGLLALALLLTSLDREEIDVEGLFELVKMWRDRARMKGMKKKL
tara:strand:- start:621 stop:1436 length:816 start_codon:yes stop_codon:yes gene_type:complete